MRAIPVLLQSLSLALWAALAPAAAQESERIERGRLVTEGVPEIPPEVRERLRRYTNVRGHVFRDWAGEGVLISTRFGETDQIHNVRFPLGARRQLTFYDEPAGGADASPDGAAFLFTKDQGGDEYHQGHLFDLATGQVSAFTEPGARVESLLWSNDGRRAAWARVTPGDPNWDILVGDPRDPSSVRVAREGEGALNPTDWSRDGRSVLVQQYISITHSRLFVLDLESGELAEINPEDEVAYSGGFILSDGDILTVTDKDSELLRLVRIDRETGAATSYTDEISWDVESVALSPDETAAAFVVNEGGLGAIKLVDLATGVVSDGPELPVGVATGLVFSPDGTRVGFTFVQGASPADAWSFDVKTLELTRWTEAEVGGLDPTGFVAPELFAYPNAEGMDIPAFIYRPAGEGPHPVIISIHGGPEGQSRPAFSSSAQYYVKELGAAVIYPNVRGSSGYGKTYVALDNGLGRKRSVEDIGALLDWIAAQPELDESRVIVMGGSYGGYMVLAALADYGDRLAGGIESVGISHFGTFLRNTEGYRRDLRRAEYGDERDPEIAAFFEEISPLNNVEKLTKPLLVSQGLNDPRVPYTESEQIVAAVRRNGGEAWYILAKDEGHGFRKRSNVDYQREAETMFLAHVLGIDAAGSGAAGEE